MQKIYIAGFDVFELNSIDIGKRYKDLCSEYGFIGLYPLDNEIDSNDNKNKMAQDIFKANIDLIKECDILIANLNPFRGKEADSGTVWECGYAYGLGKRVYGYMSRKYEYIDLFKMSEKERIENDIYTDTSDRVIEDFGYPINLMIACSVTDIIEGGFEDVLKSIHNG